MTIYRYGVLAWFWRGLIAVALVAGTGLIALAVRFGDLWFAAMAAPLLAPAVLLGFMVATRIDRVGDRLRVRTLAFIPRTVDAARLGRPRLRLMATATLVQVSAPRVWVPIQRSLPIYVDLLADIPDLGAFHEVIPLSPAVRRALSDG